MMLLALWACAVTAPEALPPALARLAESAGAIQTLSAELEQEKELAAFAEVTRSRGTFRFARPRRLRLDLDGVGGSTMLIDNDTMTVRYKTSGRVERTPLSSDAKARVVADHLFLLLSADPRALAPIYEVAVLEERPLLRIRLTPRAPALAKILASITASIDARALVHELVIREANGDRTRWRFTHHHLNEPLPDKLFQLDDAS
jgi:outer membrane lipoprotein-sorting protein